MVRGEGKKVRVARRIRWVAASMVGWSSMEQEEMRTVVGGVESV